MCKIAISIIVPVYNVEDKLERCVESILNQTYKDYELILVDDGSTDRSGEICDMYAENDARVRTVHLKNLGASVARNFGISVSNGEYISFVDSDDYIAGDYFSVLYENRSDFTMCGIQKVTEDGELLITIQYDNIVAERKTDIDFVRLMTNGEIFSPYCKLFRSDIIKQHNIRYPQDINWGEDGMFVVDYLAHIANMKTITSIGYYYVRYLKAKNSLSTKVREEVVDMVIKSREYCLDRIKIMCSEEQYKAIEKYYYSNIKKNCAYFVKELLFSETMDFESKCNCLDKFMESHYAIEAMNDDMYRWPKEMKLAFKSKSAKKIIRNYERYKKYKNERVFRFILKHFV